MYDHFITHVFCLAGPLFGNVFMLLALCCLNPNVTEPTFKTNSTFHFNPSSSCTEAVMGIFLRFQVQTSGKSNYKTRINQCKNIAITDAFIRVTGFTQGQFTQCKFFVSNEHFCSFYMTTKGCRLGNCKCLKPGSRAESFETATFFLAV